MEGDVKSARSSLLAGLWDIGESVLSDTQSASSVGNEVLLVEGDNVVVVRSARWSMQSAVVDGLESSASTVVVALVDVRALEKQAGVTEVDGGQAMFREDRELGGNVGRRSELLVHFLQLLDDSAVDDGVELTGVQVDGLSIEVAERVDLTLLSEALSVRDEAADVDLFRDEQAGGFRTGEGALSAVVGSSGKDANADQRRGVSKVELNRSKGTRAEATDGEVSHIDIVSEGRLSQQGKDEQERDERALDGHIF